jgi:hypothetical protein
VARTAVVVLPEEVGSGPGQPETVDVEATAHNRTSIPLKGMTEMTNNLTGSTALVTGGNSGIGRAAAMALTGLGARVPR